MVVLLIAATLVVPGLLVTPEVLEGVINGALVPASGNLYFVEIGDAGLSVMGRSIRVGDLVLRLNEAALDSLEELGMAPAIQFQGRLEEVTIAGVDVFRLVRNRELAADRFTVTRPAMEFVFVEPGPPAGPGVREDSTVAPRGVPSPGRRVNLATGEGLPYLSIDRVRIENIQARMAVMKAGTRDGRELESTLKGLSFELDNFLVDPASPDPARVAFSEDARLRFDSLHLELPGEVDLDAGPLSASSRDRNLRVERIAILPTYSNEEFLQGGGPPGDRIEAVVGPLSFHGVDYEHIIADLDIRVDRVLAENLQIDVLADQQRPREMKAEPWMPHDVFRTLPVRLAVDTVSVVGSSVTYTERGFKGRKTGSITIGDIQGTIRNVSQDPLRMTAETPMVLTARARLFEAASAEVQIRLPLLEPAPTMLLEASVGPFDPRLMNGVLPALEGVRVTGGEVDTAWVRIEYGPQAAKGSVIAIYRDLGVRMENRDTGEQNLGEGILSVAANLALRGKNDPGPGKAPREGAVDYAIPPGAPFFQVVWEAVSDGLVRLVRAI